ncbi:MULTISPECIES: ATP-binding cassette domain-containing protein [Corynebacterium]|uniref:Oligopeptide transport ATP-binding protein OppD n=1 Tax=Corynebacterium ramonii TaxID=3026968 RepID=A0ABN4EHJ2_9CORY|nr:MULTISPECIES: ABC transporter ATP-binding protein [Corynebacterium]AIU33195.1 Oligopeptide transport ATP-binding protein OppD [Corynebacterium ramonii FRC0011]ESU58008.1 ABC transporter ATP-binding protein [Corynebacterium ulcerans NCTC 12077]STC83292.1 Oligopeptide transport ATP-binding protein OppD [Corynebacterium ulcerans]
MTLLQVRNLTAAGILKDVALAVDRGERVGLIGESGSGKTMTALSIMRLINASGSIQLDGQELTTLSEKAMCRIRGRKIAMVFQEPMTALDPLMRVDKQIAQVLKVHSVSPRGKVAELLSSVELDPALGKRFPHELSGGQRQRVLIAMALAHDPDVLMCDEPTTALDVTSQKAIVDLILRLVAERGTGLLFITHDLGLVATTCQRILVMQGGAVIEEGTVEQVLHSPAHSYTRMLIDASQLPPARPAMITDESMVRARGVEKHYRRYKAVDGIDLHVSRGERVGIVGGSGSGKTTLLKMIAGLIRPTSGSISVSGTKKMVFQDPMRSLDPRMTIREIVAEPLPRASDERIVEVLEEVGLSGEILDRFPHEFSGGQRQRISIARALIASPDILLADEPVSALDVSVRKKVLALIDRLVHERHLTLLFVSHDLNVIRSVCSSVVVMHEGRIVEAGPVDEVFANPKAEYTKQLLAAIPHLG